MEAEAEVRGGEDGEGFDEDVGCCFVAGEVWVELVPKERNWQERVSTQTRREREFNVDILGKRVFR